jgi:hypothetical protein
LLRASRKAYWESKLGEPRTKVAIPVMAQFFKEELFVVAVF